MIIITILIILAALLIGLYTGVELFEDGRYVLAFLSCLGTALIVVSLAVGFSALIKRQQCPQYERIQGTFYKLKD